MCTWVGFIGQSNASEVCLEMLPKIERLWSGYYTGMVTADHYGLHIGKTMGNTSAWKQKFDTSLFGGNCGLFHSRTNSGGGDESAHPYFDNEHIVALVSQGSTGYFSIESRMQTSKYGNILLKAGYSFSTAIPGGMNGRRPMLDDGTGVCLSEVVANAVAFYYKQCKNPFESVRFIATEIPEESVTGIIFADYPDKMFFVNTSQSLMAGYGNNGIYLSTSTLAFPKSVKNITQLDYNSVTEITAAGWHSEKLSSKYDIMKPLPDEAQDHFTAWLSTHPGALLPNVVDGALRPLCTQQKSIYPCSAVGYRILEKLFKAGKIRFIPFNKELDGLILE